MFGVGGWRLEVRGWRLEVGGWRFRDKGKFVSVRELLLSEKARLVLRSISVGGRAGMGIEEETSAFILHP